jgi:hypothetical protein
MERPGLSTLDSFFTPEGRAHGPAPKVPAEYFLSEIRRITGLSKEELAKSDIGDVENVLEKKFGMRFELPCLLIGIHESATTLHTGMYLGWPHDSRRRRKAIDRLLERDAPRPAGTAGRIRTLLRS